MTSPNSEPNKKTTGAKLPEWAAGIRRDFTSGAASVFLIHGLRDRFPHRDGYVSLRQFIYRAFCGNKRTLIYDIGQGLSFESQKDQDEYLRFLKVQQGTGGAKTARPGYLRPIEALPLLEEFLFSRNNAAVVVDFVDKIVPTAAAQMMSHDDRRILTTLRRWATDPRLTARNSFVFLIADSLGDVNRELYARGQSVHVVDVGLPSEDERRAFITYVLNTPEELTPNGAADFDPRSLLDVSQRALAQNTNGLTRMQIGSLMRSATPEDKVDLTKTAQHKRRAIEAEIGDLVEFVQPAHGLEAVGGTEMQKALLLDTADALRKGYVDVVPKGILLTGPPGCGKTFCMECFAHDCEIPFVQLKNVFSKYVGATESNLEKLFHYLEVLAPIFVFIDEFDQSYGRRVTGDSDSGVSRRVFGMFNAFLSDESHQGKILFGAATNRPDLIDPSTIRAGRFDLKVPFLSPDEPTREAILSVILKTLGIKARGTKLDEIAEKTAGYSGADLREIIRLAQRKSVYEGHKSVTQTDLDYAVGDYLSPNAARADEIRLMELLAIANTTSRAMLSADQLRLIESGELHPEIERLKARIGE